MGVSRVNPNFFFIRDDFLFGAGIGARMDLKSKVFWETPGKVLLHGDNNRLTKKPLTFPPRKPDPRRRRRRRRASRRQAGSALLSLESGSREQCLPIPSLASGNAPTFFLVRFLWYVFSCGKYYNGLRFVSNFARSYPVRRKKGFRHGIFNRTNTGFQESQKNRHLYVPFLAILIQNIQQE